MHTTPDGPAQESGEGAGALRIKSLAPSERKVFFAHLKGARQVHFTNRSGEPGKARITSIHPSGAGGVGSKHDVTMYCDEAFRLQRRLRRFARNLAVTGKID